MNNANLLKTVNENLKNSKLIDSRKENFDGYQYTPAFLEYETNGIVTTLVYASGQNVEVWQRTPMNPADKVIGLWNKKLLNIKDKF